MYSTVKSHSSVLQILFPYRLLQNTELRGRALLVSPFIFNATCVLVPAFLSSPPREAPLSSPFLHVQAQPLRGSSVSARGRELGCGLSGAPASAPPDPGPRAWCLPVSMSPSWGSLPPRLPASAAHAAVGVPCV